MKLIGQAYSRMGIALIMYLVLGDVAAAALSALLPYFPEYMKNYFFLYLIVYGVSLPVFLLFSRWSAAAGPGLFEQEGRVKRRMKPWQLLMTFVMTMGAAYVCNYLGIFINLWVSRMRGGDVWDMNPVYSMMDRMDPLFALYVGLLGPVVEEIIYRGIVLGQLKRFGEMEAVIFSALAFGLMHGNISQTLYATAIGLIFGFVAVRSGGIRYSCILHVMVNSYSLLLSVGLEAAYASGIPSLPSLYGLFTSGLTLAFVIAGLVFFVLLARGGNFRMRSGARAMGVSGPAMARAMFFNPGFGLFAGVCLLSILNYMF